MSVCVVLRAPTMSDPLRVELPPKGALLIGRAPDPSSVLAPAEGAAPEIVGTVTVPSPRVSANHLLIEQRHEGIFVTDLHSRNGSWLRLVPGRTVGLPMMDLSVDLTTMIAASSDVGPSDVVWQKGQKFGPVVLETAQKWVQSQGIDARLSLLDPRHRGPEPMVSLWLADRSELGVTPRPGTTLTSGWIDRLSAWVHTQNLVFEQESAHDADFVMASPALRNAHRQLADAALRGRRVILLGETGCGKEVLARCYHDHSPRKNGAWVVVNCGAIPEGDLLLSELFGARAGSFTDGTRDIIGAVEAAKGGTMLLDEVGDLPMKVQVALLRFLDKGGEFRRLGDDHRPRTADVRIVSATNKDLEAMVERGEFRQDLWFRLNGRVIRVPPLRERREDILAFLKSRSVRPGLLALDALSPEALDIALSHSWPGNFRELDNFVERLDWVMTHGRCTAAQCREALQQPTTVRTAPPRPRPNDPGALSLDEASWRELLAQASEVWAAEHEGNAPSRWADQDTFMEEYVKPLFVAYRCDKREIKEITRGLNLTEMAKALSLSDGGRVKHYLTVYLHRFVERRGVAPEVGRRRE